MSKRDDTASSDEESKSNVRSLAWARVEPPTARKGKGPSRAGDDITSSRDDEKLLEGPTAEERARSSDGPLLPGQTAEQRQRRAREEQLESTKRLARELKASPKKGRGPGDRRH